MKSKLFLGVLVIGIMLGLTSCPETSVPRDFGAKPLKLKNDDWSGVWSNAGDRDDFRFEIKNAAEGQMMLMSPNPEKKTEEAMEILAHEIGVKAGEGLIFLTVFEKPGDMRGTLHLMSVPNEGIFHIWSIQNEVIEAAIKTGELKGELKSVKEKGDDKSHNHGLLAATAANYAKLTDPKFWEWTKPETFVRQGKSK